MNLPDTIKCSECDRKAYQSGGYGMTLVGYSSPPGHDHDDNCVSVTYKCEDGHEMHISPRRKCPNKSCSWKGVTECFCHKGKKLDW